MKKQEEAAGSAATPTKWVVIYYFSTDSHYTLNQWETYAADGDDARNKFLAIHDNPDIEIYAIARLRDLPALLDTALDKHPGSAVRSSWTVRYHFNDSPPVKFDFRCLATDSVDAEKQLQDDMRLLSGQFEIDFTLPSAEAPPRPRDERYAVICLSPTSSRHYLIFPTIGISAAGAIANFEADTDRSDIEIVAAMPFWMIPSHLRRYALSPGKSEIAREDFENSDPASDFWKNAYDPAGETKAPASQAGEFPSDHLPAAILVHDARLIRGVYVLDAILNDHESSFDRIADILTVAALQGAGPFASYEHEALASYITDAIFMFRFIRSGTNLHWSEDELAASGSRSPRFAIYHNQ